MYPVPPAGMPCKTDRSTAQRRQTYGIKTSFYFVLSLICTIFAGKFEISNTLCY
ncbi:hypothetical protein HMPREF0663_11010 [Hoylesella oralis ATCC 33269]|uniref:Uncharacterized protein n=1 Tax=Hoylesella oralis ATCC 33269 TaxID=873533 RepID=E7RPA9_9BACT|nr:hypothetical protein HMPREF0663_11010 [Hoylesella oralis ATCC 33269]